mmetsp:Transcript_31237/g.93724  ORF Transcript_31237/g.93724 Transcript_31237/m.93724 type:complete len:475 (+) Transcript_31237:23-1447(+)
MGRFQAPAWNSRPQLLLDGLALCIADIQGLWAVLFVYCTSPTHEGGLGMHVSVAGGAMLVQGLLSTLLGPVIGRLHDRTTKKRYLFGALPVMLIVITWGMINFSRDVTIVLMALLIQGIAGGAYPPGICALSFGVVGTADFPQRASRNEMWKHAGAVITAGILPIFLVDSEEGGWATYFLVMVCVNISALVLLSPLRDSDIVDHDNGPMAIEQGAPVADGLHHAVVPIKELLSRPEIILFMLSVTMFHLGNAAMLPQLGYKVDQLYNTNNTAGTSVAYFGASLELDGKNAIGVATIISQVVMIPVAKFSGTLASSPYVGSKKLLMFGCVVLIIRGFWIATAHNSETLLWSSVLDGVAAGIFGVCSILLMSDLTEGTGQFATMQGMVATCLGLGSSISHGLAGEITEEQGVDFTMFFLAGLACIPVVLLIFVPDRRCHWGFHPIRGTFDEKKVLLHDALYTDTRYTDNQAYEVPA